MKPNICIKCGKDKSWSETDTRRGTEASRRMFALCEDCFLQKHELFRLDNISLAVCQCGSHYFSKQEKFDDLENALKSGIEKRIKTRNKISSIKIRIKRHFGHKYQIVVSANGKISPCKKSKTEEKTIIATVKNLTCEDCIKVLGNYHEAKVQLRGKDIAEMIKKAQHILPKTSWVKENPDGYDVFFITKTDAANFVKQFKEKYEIKKSFKIVAQKKDRVLARDVYVIR